MLIELKDLEIHPVDFREEFSPGAIDLGTEVRQTSPLRSQGRANLVEEHHGKHKVVRDIRVKGKLETSLEVACARCLEPVVHQVERSFDLLVPAARNRRRPRRAFGHRRRGRNRLLPGRRFVAGRHAA